MSGRLIAIVVILWLALSVIAFALMPGRGRRRPPLPVRSRWDEDREYWTTVPDAGPKPSPALIDLTPGIDLALRDDCELLWSMPAYQRPANHTTTEGD